MEVSFLLQIEVSKCTGCFKSLGHILTMNISETIKDIKTHLVNSESLLSQFLRGMFKNVQYEYHWSHDTHQADSPILAKRVPALHSQCLQQLLLFVPSAHPDLTPRNFSRSHAT